MQNCYSIQPSLISLASSNDLPQLEDASLSELFGDNTSYLYPPWNQDFCDLTSTIKDVNEDCSDASYFPQLVPRSQACWKAKPYSLISRLKDLYHEELRKNVHVPDGRTTSYLLSKLIERDRFNMVVVTLYPVSDGFSVSFTLESGKTLEEEAKYPYTQDTLLEYIDNEQLPTPFLEYWEHSVPHLFYDGCIICRVKDLRHGVPATVSHVLLKPHTQSLIGDVNKLIMDSDVLWAPEEQFSMESDIVNNANRSLCLDPNPEVGKRILKLYQDRRAFDTRSIRKLLYRNSPLLQSRKRKYEHLLPRANPYLSDFIASKKPNVSVPSKSIDIDNEMKVSIPRLPCISSRDILSEVCRFAKPLDSQPDSDDFTPHLIKEWILENKKGANTHHVRLTILQRPVNFEFLCQIYMDNRYIEGKSNGSTCRFTLGSRANAHRFVKQYIEIYTEEGRQIVDITQLGPGQIIK